MTRISHQEDDFFIFAIICTFTDLTSFQLTQGSTKQQAAVGFLNEDKRDTM